ncbi:hypothetical protein E8M24_32540 [Bacillus thuringiensis]|uniref:hypothetical protein n=1 Tax=Bacillus thuringiensis TaxID=1428 RepID=UPI00125EF51D|nr:hypothetical protein [Bacillus thuringiensis]KAB5624470.1 hypothetical protein E8M24_32540 [Bacillus thuringiensis]HDR5272039.1 hypothetical protein [Bacillus thuringiensis]
MKIKLLNKILKSYTFWFFIFGLLVCYINIIGQDSKDIIFFFAGYEPVLYYLTYKEPFRSLIIDFNQGILTLTSYAYIFRVVTLLMYGAFFDYIRYLGKYQQLQKYLIFLRYLMWVVIILVSIFIFCVMINSLVLVLKF